MDKGVIIDMAKEIGTYETSILPFDDCCTLFSPKHPVVRPNLETLRESYAKMAIEGSIVKPWRREKSSTYDWEETFSSFWGGTLA